MIFNPSAFFNCGIIYSPDHLFFGSVFNSCGVVDMYLLINGATVFVRIFAEFKGKSAGLEYE